MYLDKIEELVHEMVRNGFDHPTEFEVLTAVAFQYFKDQKVDVSVIEVGMGGLYDSTNVVCPLVSVITSIDYDHQTYLGNTIEEISLNKAGIIKIGVPIVAGVLPEDALRVIKDHAEHMKAKLISSQLVKVDRIGDSVDGIVSINGPGIKIMKTFFNLLGDYQMENLSTALTAVLALADKGFIVQEQHIRKTLAEIEFPGRLQILCRDPLIVADAAHNPHGCKALNASLQALWPDRVRVMVTGMLDDKDAYESLAVLGEQTRVCIITRPDSERANQWRRLSSIWRSLFPASPVYEVEDPRQAVQMGIGILKANEYMLISGSFYLLGKVYPFMESLK